MGLQSVVQRVASQAMNEMNDISSAQLPLYCAVFIVITVHASARAMVTHGYRSQPLYHYDAPMSSHPWRLLLISVPKSMDSRTRGEWRHRHDCNIVSLALSFLIDVVCFMSNKLITIL